MEAIVATIHVQLRAQCTSSTLLNGKRFTENAMHQQCTCMVPHGRWPFNIPHPLAMFSAQTGSASAAAVIAAIFSGSESTHRMKDRPSLR